MQDQSKQLLVLEASAGSGKTYALALRYVTLLLEGAKIGEILALTFTIKAAKEMKERIEKFLFILGREEFKLTKQEREERQRLLENLGPSYRGEDLSRIASLVYEDFLTQSPKITTIDSFLNTIIRRFCWYVGVPYHFEIGELDELEVFEVFLRKIHPREKRYFIKLCLDHQISAHKLFTLILELAERHADCIFSHPRSYSDPSAIKKRVMEQAYKIKERVQQDLIAGDSAKRAVDFDSFYSLLQKGKTWITKGKQYRDFKKLSLDEGMFDELQKELLEFFANTEGEFFFFLREFCDLYRKAKDECIKTSNTLHFQDITHKSYELLWDESLSRDFFYFRLDDQISHILLDEFQDTSIMQYKLLLPLIEEILSGDGRIKERSFFVVGDQKQSIYSFRGGYGGLMEYVKSLHPCIQSDHLSKNYRSDGVIVQFVNHVFSKSMKDYIPQEAKNDQGYVKICEPINLKDQEGKKQILVFEEVRAVIHQLLELGVGLHQIAILAFKNQDVLELGDYLKEFFDGIITEESVALSEKKDAQILLNALDYASHHNPLSLANLKKLLGYLLEDEIETLELESSIADFIYRAIQLYKLNSLVASKVFEIACEVDCLEEFTKRVKAFRDLNEEQQGLKILTIHKSKGLEYDHLIVIDRLSGDSPRRDPYFCSYDENLQGELYFKQLLEDKVRLEIDTLYANVNDKEREKEEREKKNLLYVAFTRSCHSLWIMPVLKDRSKSAFELIGLIQDDHIAFKNEWGKMSYFQSKDSHFEEMDAKKVEQIRFGAQEDFLQKPKHVYKPNQIRAIKEGEVLHKALELYLGYGVGDQELKNYLDNHFGFFLENLQKVNILSSLKEIKLLLMNHFDSSEIKSEIAFIQNSKLHRIDCLILVRDQQNCVQSAIVIDYKSGGRQTYYQEQVRNYVDFVKTQYRGADVRGYLFYYLDFELVQVV